MDKEDASVARFVVKLALGIAALVLLIVLAIQLIAPQLKVYEQRLHGEAELAKAQFSKQVLVQEAIAKQEAAKSLAQAEVERAKGVAEANRIIGDSLQGNDAYLRYLWIQQLDNAGHVVYVPTEAGLPILEAGHRDR